MRKSSKPAKPAKTANRQSPAKPAATKAHSLEAIYGELEKILLRHAPPCKRGALAVRDKRSLELVVPKPVAVPGAYGGKPVDLQLAALILQKDYVGFYLMCIYMNAEVKKKISPALLKLLKGKTCFHIKALDEALKNDIEAALALGVKNYRERGWL